MVTEIFIFIFLQDAITKVWFDERILYAVYKEEKQKNSSKHRTETFQT